MNGVRDVLTVSMLNRCQLHRISYWSRSFSSIFTSGGHLGFRREYSTHESSPGPNVGDKGSIFSKSESAWDHVFNDIQTMPPLLPSSFRPHFRSDLNAKEGSRPQKRRQSMTAREILALDEMFNTIFDAVAEHKPTAGSSDPLSDVGIGKAPTGKTSHMDFFSRMRGHSKRLKWSAQSNEELDRKNEEMELCDTDHQLLEWAMREVFGESKRFEEATRKAVSDVAAGKELLAMPELQPAIYPHLVAQLMRTFRDKYRDPHLALSMFDHARHLSIPSYVFGCTTPAYNELIETRWRCFRDLKGVHDALEEMTVNGVDPDNRTRNLVEELRRQVGERNKWEEENELGSGEVWLMLNKIERLIVRHGKRSQKDMYGQRRQNPSDEAWKKVALSSEVRNDDWEFGKWGDEYGGRTGTRGASRLRPDEKWDDWPSRERRRSDDDNGNFVL